MVKSLKAEIESWKQKVNILQEKLTSTCIVLYNVIRAAFTLKYHYKDKSPNPYKSNLTEDANYLMDVLEQKSRMALIDA